MAERERVLICGAGPVGLLTALGLARAGAAVTVIEAGSGLSQSPRANGYFPPTIELLDAFGVLAEVEAAAYQSTDVSFHFRLVGERITFSLSTLEGSVKFPYFLHLGQHELGQIILGTLAAFDDVEILFGTRLLGIEQDARGVTAAVEMPAGQRSLRAAWLVGADGARSTVRTQLGLPFEGFTWPDRFVATNMRFDFEAYGFAPSNMIHHPVDWAVVSRLGRENTWRVTYGEDPELPEADVLARIPGHYARILPSDAPYEVIAAAPYRVHERTAPRYRGGRVLLAGDAAHACNPCGGMGLTSGAFDALMLSQALGAVIGGTAPETLLDDYSRERRRVFLEVASPTAQDHKRRITEGDEARQREVAAIFKRVATDPAMMRDGMMHSFLVRGNPLALPA